MLPTEWRRPTGFLIFTRHFLQKSPIIHGSHAERDLQLKTSYDSSSTCIWHSLSMNAAMKKQLLNLKNICLTHRGNP